MAALSADDFRMLAVVNRDGIAEEITECHMMPAIEPEFPPLEAFDDLSQGLLAFVSFSLCPGHGVLLSRGFHPMTALMEFFWRMRFVETEGVIVGGREDKRVKRPSGQSRRSGETARCPGVRARGLEGEGVRGKPCLVRSEAEDESRRAPRRGVTHVSPRRWLKKKRLRISRPRAVTAGKRSAPL